MSTQSGSPIARLMKTAAKVEPEEIKAVIVSFAYFFLLFGSYYIVRPIRDAMGTVYGVENYDQLYLGTFILSFIIAPIYAFLASRFKLSSYLPWVNGFVAATLFIFFLLFQSDAESKDRWVAAAFFCWVSTFNVLTISVFWSLMADTFSKAQAQRVFGFIAAGGTMGTIIGPILTAALVNVIGTNLLLLISAFGFVLTAFFVRVLTGEKATLAVGNETQAKALDRKLGGNPFEGFMLILKSPYLLMLAVFVLFMTTISTIIYFQLGDLISKQFETREARTQAYAYIDLAVNSTTVLIQLFGTSRFIQRFGVKVGLMINPFLMAVAFLAIAFSPLLIVLGSIQVARRFSEYAVAKPSRDMLFTVVDQEAKYKAKNVIDTVVYRFGDLISSKVSDLILPFGVVGLAIAGVIASIIWFPIAYMLGKRYEKMNTAAGQTAATPAHH